MELEILVVIDENGLVRTEPNPAGLRYPGEESVAWRFQGAGDALPVIRFRRFEPRLDSNTTEGDARLGPFEEVSYLADAIIGRGSNGRRGRFVYDILLLDPTDRDGEARVLDWNPPLGNTEQENGGGLDVPERPDA